MRTVALIAVIVLIGCNLDLDMPDPAGCEARRVYHLDADGDGVGDGTHVYVGCEPPGPGWVEQGPDTAAPTDTADTADTAG